MIIPAKFSQNPVVKEEISFEAIIIVAHDRRRTTDIQGSQ